MVLDLANRPTVAVAPDRRTRCQKPDARSDRWHRPNRRPLGQTVRRWLLRKQGSSTTRLIPQANAIRVRLHLSKQRFSALRRQPLMIATRQDPHPAAFLRHLAASVTEVKRIIFGDNKSYFHKLDYSMGHTAFKRIDIFDMMIHGEKQVERAMMMRWPGRQGEKRIRLIIGILLAILLLSALTLVLVKVFRPKSSPINVDSPGRLSVRRRISDDRPKLPTILKRA